MAYDIPVARSVVDNGPFRSHVASGFPNLRIKKLFLVGAPLGIAAILISLTMNIPRYALSIHSGLTTLGVFFQMTLIIQAGDRFFRAIEQPFTPRMAEYLRKGEKKRFWNLLTKTTLLLVMAGTVAAVICFAGGPVVWSTIYSGNPDGLGFPL